MLPRSALPASEALTGLVPLCLAWTVAVALRPPPFVAAQMVLLAAAVPMLLREVARADTSPGSGAGPAPWHRPLASLVGFLAASAPAFLLFGTTMKLRFWSEGWLVALPAFLVRFAFELARTRTWGQGFSTALGTALLHRDVRGLRRLAEPARQWLLKSIFIPVYSLILYSCVKQGQALWESPLLNPILLVVIFVYTVDLTFVASGYIFATTKLGTGFRSTQQSVFGWAVCLVCYPPLMLVWSQAWNVLCDEMRRPAAISGSPSSLLVAGVMLAFLSLYIWAEVSFGLRFSNLGYRGIITHGPYRLMEHPAYFCHSANAWMSVLVLFPMAGVRTTPSLLAAACVISLAYRLRARTEEAHLREEPDYVAYAAWIKENGLLARARRLATALAGRPRVPARVRSEGD